VETYSWRLKPDSREMHTPPDPTTGATTASFAFFFTTGLHRQNLMLVFFASHERRHRSVKRDQQFLCVKLEIMLKDRVPDCLKIFSPRFSPEGLWNTAEYSGWLCFEQDFKPYISRPLRDAFANQETKAEPFVFIGGALVFWTKQARILTGYTGKFFLLFLFP
jgi:hypothetical protein